MSYLKKTYLSMALIIMFFSSCCLKENKSDKILTNAEPGYLILEDSIIAIGNEFNPNISYKFNHDKANHILKSIFIYSDLKKIQEIMSMRRDIVSENVKNEYVQKYTSKTMAINYEFAYKKDVLKDTFLNDKPSSNSFNFIGFSTSKIFSSLLSISSILSIDTFALFINPIELEIP